MPHTWVGAALASSLLCGLGGSPASSALAHTSAKLRMDSWD